ncbi:MAG: hypothetical protein AABY22_36050, partial [Nanoarchaeota archaeon]
MKIIDKILPITEKLAKCLEKHFPEFDVYCINDIEGEDHIFAKHGKKPVFDMLISTSRKFAFLWYYIHPKKGMKMVAEMKKISLSNNKDFVVKFPNVPTQKPSSVNSKVHNKALYPTIMRFGKRPSGLTLEEFIVKTGNPDLEEKIYSAGAVKDFRIYNWNKIPKALDLILKRSKEMLDERLHDKSKKKNIIGYFLYAGCAYSYVYPKLGFGMRDIDVEVLFNHKWYTNTRAAFTRHCEIDEFGKPKYFNEKTRWLDLMWNSVHSEKKTLKETLVNYMNEMRHNSDRWATMSQRPFINLETKALWGTYASHIM